MRPFALPDGDGQVGQGVAGACRCQLTAEELESAFDASLKYEEAERKDVSAAAAAIRALGWLRKHLVLRADQFRRHCACGKDAA